MKTDAETNLAGVKKAAEDASGGVNTTTVTNWGNSASEVKKNLDKMKQIANLKLGEMQKTVESHFSGQYNTMTKKWEKACERIGQLITQMVRSTKDSLNGLARNMNTIGNEMSNNLINGISGAVTGIAGILNEVVSKVNSTIGNVNSSLSGIEKRLMKIMDFQKMKIKDWVNFARILRCGTRYCCCSAQRRYIRTLLTNYTAVS